MAAAKTTGTKQPRNSHETTTKEPEKPRRLNIYEKLENIQAELKAPKTQEARNKNGQIIYKYRLFEDILEGLKPLLERYDTTLVLDDDIVQIGERFYIRAEATLIDAEAIMEERTGWGQGKVIKVRAYARETDTVSGLGDAQVTAAASSYARKQALNGLFLIDDTEPEPTAPPITQDTEEKPTAPPITQNSKEKATASQIKTMQEIAAKMGKQLDEAAVKNWSMDRAAEWIDQHKGK